MADFLTTKGTAFEIEKMIMEAGRELYLVSPYLKLSTAFQQRLKDANGRGVSIRIVYGKDEMKETEKGFLAGLDKVELYYSENLHAKCYFNETRMVVTSMNMYEFSENNNTEMGILVVRAADKDLYEKACRETQSIVNNARKVTLRKPAPAPRATHGDKLTKAIAQALLSLDTGGHCIRCHEPVDYHPDKPYCYDCYQKWAEYGNADYKEKYCHGCGKPAKTSLAKPECHACYK